MASVRVRAPATMSPPAKIPGRAGHHVGPDRDDPVRHGDLGHGAQEREVRLLPECQDHRVRPQLLDLARGLREPVLVELHPLDRENVALGADDGREPLEPYTLVDGVLHLLDVGGHALAGAAIDDDGVLGTEPARRASGIHGRIATAVDHAPLPRDGGS